jgi:hypothetical protein
MKEPIDNWLDRLISDAYADRDLEKYAFYTYVKGEIAMLHALGKVAARIYNDHSDEAAWSELYEALSDAGMLQEEDETPHEHQA